MRQPRTGLQQQTGFRADKELLNRFRSKLALEGLDMGPVIETFITGYVAGEEALTSRRNELHTTFDIEPAGAEWKLL